MVTHMARLATLTLAGTLACCTLLGACEPTEQRPDPVPVKPHAQYRDSRIVSFTDTYSISGLADGGPALWANTNQGLLRWDLQQGRYGVFTTKDGLPDGKLLAITIDREGAVWVATQTAVARGTREGWKTYPPAPVGDAIVGLAASPDRDELWVAGRQGVARLRDGAWSHYFADTPITAMSTGADGNVWLGTNGHGVLRVSRAGDQIDQYTQSEGCEVNTVRALAEGNGWVLAVGEGVLGSRLAIFDGTRFWSYTIDATVGKLDVGPPVDWAARGGADLYIGKGQSFFRVVKDRFPADAHQGALRFTAIAARAASPRMVPLVEGVSAKVFDTLEHMAPNMPAPKVEPGKKPSIAPMGPPLYTVYQSQKLPEGVTAIASGDRGVLVGTRFRGMVRIENGLLRAFPTEDITAGAERITVACTRSATDECYLATGGERAWHYDGQSFTVAAIDPEPDARVLAIVRDPKGSVLAIHRGAHDSLLRISRVADGKWTPIAMQNVAVPVGAPDLNFASFAPNGNLWIGLRYIDAEREPIDYGAAEINLNDGKVLYHRLDPALPEAQQLPNNVVAMAWKGEDEAWFATRSGAVRLLAGKLTTYTENEGLEDEIIHDIEAASGNEVWVATRRGTGRYDGVRWRFPKLGAFYLPANALARDDVGHMFVGTDKGLYCVGECTDEAIDQQHGLLDDVVRDLSVDERRRAWVLTKRGVSIVEP
jgi:hypothetical protein